MTKQLEQVVRNCLAGIAKRPLPEDSTALLNLHLVHDLELDSLDIIAFHFNLEDHLGTRFPEEEIASPQMLNLGNLLGYLSNS